MMLSLPNIIKKEKKQRKFFLTLVFKAYSLHAILAEEVEFSFVIRHSSEKKLDEHINKLSIEELTQIGDSLVSPLERYVSKPSDIDKTVFSIPHDWVEDNKITKDRLSVLKKFCEALSLTPIGFIVNSEAIVNKLHQIEGVPLSGIIVGVSGNNVLVHVVKNNEVLKSIETEIEENLITTLEKTLSETELEVLPNRIILLESEETEKIKNDLLSHTWPQKIPFLQLPTVSVFKKGLEYEAITEGVSRQLKLDISFGDTPEEVVENEPEKEAVELTDMHEFGFEEDGEEKAEEEVKEESNVVPVAVPEFSHIKEEEEHIEEKSLVNKSEKKSKKIVFPQIPFKMPSIGKFNLSSFLKELRYRPGLIMIPVTLLIIIAVVVFIYLRFMNVTRVVVFTDAKKVELDTDIVLSSENDPNIEVPILPLGTIAEKVEAEAKRATTGEKETGETAKGEVTLFNKTESSIDFEEGDVVISENDLEFALTADVSVASTSAFSTEFSSAKVAIEASSFGKEFNLPKDTNFTIQGRPSSSYFGKNSEAFSGGTKTVSQVVSEDDIEALEEEIIESVEEKAREQAVAKIGEDQTLLDQILSSDLSNLSFSKKAGEEADEVTVTGDVVFEFGVYNKADVEKLARGLSEEEIPSSYIFNRDQSKITLENLEFDEDEVSARLIADAVYTPTIKTDDIQERYKGKLSSSLKKTLESVDGVREVRILPKLSIPILSSFLPLSANNIQIEVKSEV